MERWARGPRTPVPPAQCGDADGLLLQAAARHQCRYLVNLHVLQFLRAGGDPQWLRGLDFIPPKLRNLNEINKILAHRPWLITKEHIEVYQPRTRVVMGTAASPGGAGTLTVSHRWSICVLQKLLKISEWSWSLAELVHAVVLLAHCHALASFVFGCGCEQDDGLGGRGLLKPLSPGNQCFCEVTTGNSCSQELLRINRKRVSPRGWVHGGTGAQPGALPSPLSLCLCSLWTPAWSWIPSGNACSGSTWRPRAGRRQDCCSRTERKVRGREQRWACRVGVHMAYLGLAPPCLYSYFL